MGEGLDKVARSLLELEPTAILDLFLVYPDSKADPNNFYPMHNGSVFKKGVVWQGITYMPIGMEIEGFEVNADGKINRPKLKISNKDFYVTNLLKRFDDFSNAKITRKRTFVKFLDDENFDGGNPFGESDSTAELSRQDYIVSQKVQENKIYVELELTSPLDLDNFELNHRRIMGKYCYWQYRGNGCQYRGVPVNKENGKPFENSNGEEMTYNGDFAFGRVGDEYQDRTQYTTGDLVFLKNNRVKIHDPEGVNAPTPILTYYIAKTDVKGVTPSQDSEFWDKDGCNKKLSSCKLRFTDEATTQRFKNEEELDVNYSSFSEGKDETSYYLQPERFTPFLTDMKGSSWTLVMSFKKISKNRKYAGYFRTTTGDSRYGAINIATYNKDNRNRFRMFYGTENKSKRKLTTKKRRFKQLKNYQLIIKKINDYTIQYQELKFDDKKRSAHHETTQIQDPDDANEYVETVVGDLITGDYQDFSFMQSLFYKPKNKPYQKRSPENDLEGICFWNTALSNDEVESLFLEDTEGKKRLRPISYFTGQQNINNDTLKGWWTEPFTGVGESGIKDSSDNNNDLIFKADTTAANLNFNITGQTYNVNIEDIVDTQEATTYLPFGGFPGTDGFNFERGV